MNNTPMTDERKASFALDTIRQLETELAAVTEQRDRLAENNTPTPKIIQLLMSPNNSVWQGVLLGLGDDGATYHCQGDTWQPYIPPLEAEAFRDNMRIHLTESDGKFSWESTAAQRAEAYLRTIGKWEGGSDEPQR